MEHFYPDYLRPTQREAIEEQNKYKKCLINMWCGTGKTRTFTIDLFIKNEKINVIVFPSLGLINQYCNDYALSTDEPFKTEFEKYKCLAFCSDDDGKLKSKGKIPFTTDEKSLNTFLNKKDNKIVLVTYQSFEKFINICIDKNININNLIFDEAHHIVGDKIQNIVFNNEALDAIVDKTRFYTATPVNKNGITMYDRDDPENSDCGPLAYEYLYYQAVEDGVCKPFETQISLYTQKPEYKDKYQPVFECIIRACLSGKYDYWNILTYHSFVNENENLSESISYVKEFASPKNQTLVKKLFTKIQNDEFPHTKDTYSVENVILKGVHSKTPTRQQIIQDFDRKVEGRIYILSSCGILNEGIDTKWANMGVPIDPSKSIVKESQRIGRLVRIPEPNMPPAIILIPCMIDILEYKDLNSLEEKDKHIREQISNSGNFNTALNVISAFKYQYDPDLYELCLKYHNKYTPKEIEQNLNKHGYKLLPSKGDLIDNIMFLNKHNNTENFENIEKMKDKTDIEIFHHISKNNNTNFEIHYQSYSKPIKTINLKNVNMEPLRLFYNENNIYQPIVKKEKKEKNKKINPPSKRHPLFKLDFHNDLDILLSINDYDFETIFSQGIIDVSIEYNVDKWCLTFEKLKNYISTNNWLPENHTELGRWLLYQNNCFRNKRSFMKKERIYKLWNEFINDSIFSKYLKHLQNSIIKDKTNNEINPVKKYNNYEKWNNSYEKKVGKMKNYSQPNFYGDNTVNGDYGLKPKDLLEWINNQDRLYDTKKGVMEDQEIYNIWSQFKLTDDYEYFMNDPEWHLNLQYTKKFIDKFNYIPPTEGVDFDNYIIWVRNKEIHSKDYGGDVLLLGKWLIKQKKYSNIDYKKLVPKIYESWNEMINNPKYSKYFKKKEDVWLLKLEQIKNFIDELDKTNNGENKLEENNFYQHINWFKTQKKNFNSGNKLAQINKFKVLYQAWTEALNDEKYHDYFKIIDNEKLNIEYCDNISINKSCICIYENCCFKSNLQNVKDHIKKCKFNVKCKHSNTQTLIDDFKKNNSDKYNNILIDYGRLFPGENEEADKLAVDYIVNHLYVFVENKYEPTSSLLGQSEIEKIKKNKKCNLDRRFWNKKIPYHIISEFGEFGDESKKKGGNLLKKYNDFKNKYILNEICKKYEVIQEILECEILDFKITYTLNRNKKHLLYHDVSYFIEKNTKDDPEIELDFIGLSKNNYILDYSGEKKLTLKFSIIKPFNIPIKKYTIKCWNVLYSNPLFDRLIYRFNIPFDKANTICSEQVTDIGLSHIKQTKDMSKPEIKPKKTDKEIKAERQQRTQSELSQLHKEYKTKNSQNLNTYFKENPKKWEEYHKISQENEESFPEEEIPRNKMIKYLEDLPGKKKKVVADLGCGFAEINQHFKDNSRFVFHNFDHHSDNELVTEKDIKNTELEDYSVDVAILSLAMWGSNCKDYLEEAHRILDTGGTLLIAEAYKRWNKELDKEERPINRLVKLLEESNFTIIENIEQKFMFIECRKN